MRKRLAQVYLVLFTVLAIGGLIYGVHDHPLMEGLTRDEVRGAFKTNNPLKAGFINIGMPLADRSVAYRSKTFPKARRRAGSTPQLYDRCFFTQQQLDEMDDQTAEAVINEAIDFFEMSPSAMLTLKEVMELSPESEIRKKLDFPLGQEDLKASFVNCYLNRLLPFGQFAEIAAPTLLKLLTQRSDAANVAEVISRMEGIHFEPSEVEQLLTLMSSKDWNLQQAATKFLSRGTEEVIPFLIAAVTTPGESADNRRKFALTALFEAADRYPNVDLAQVIKEILLDAKEKLRPGGRIVVNAIALETAADTIAFFRKFPKDFSYQMIQVQVQRFRAIGAYDMAQALNPIYILTGIYQGG